MNYAYPYVVELMHWFLRQAEMVYEALVALKSPNGSDASAIFNYIEVCCKGICNLINVSGLLDYFNM